ncbi:DUF927 domain-containing protein [Novosphingobium sp.]|uniref:DUF927 domain-containing protein n=1 Tax=Novosphingobium sp. TaxID=1874826 RepID=UPI0025E06E0B|nr:DUF927 domain-containing protein [Novosphingobium sp.]
MDNPAPAYSRRDHADYEDDAIRDSFSTAKAHSVKLPFGFHLSDKGLFQDQDDDKGPLLLCGPLEIVAETRDRHSTAWGVLLRWNDNDNQPHQLAVARANLAGDGREVRQLLLHGGLYVAPSIKARNALQTFLASVKIDRRARAVARVGWADGAFALPDRTIGISGGDLVVYQGAGTVDHEYRSAGTLAEWQEGVARHGIGNTRIAIALCAGFVGPLLEAVGGEGGGIHLRGQSSIGKSTALLAAASIWGSPSFVRQWRATANGLEGIAEQANETLLILDELAQLDAKEAGSIAYMLANGCGKSRASQTGDARAARRWLTFFLSSGEISLAEHARSDGRGRRSAAGQEVRILDIEADAGKGFGLFDSLGGLANGDALARSIKGAAAEHYGIAGPEFVERLIGEREAQARLIRQGIDRFANDCQPADASGQVARACRRFGLIAMAGEIATGLGILPWAPGEATGAAKAIFASWLLGRGGAGAAEDGAAIEQIAEFLTAHGAARFQPIDGDGPVVIHNRAGFWRLDPMGRREYLIPATIWKAEVCRGLNVKAVSALLLERRHLFPDNAGKASVSVALPGMGKTRCYIVQQSIFGGDDA